jgi:hypothetical protein
VISPFRAEADALEAALLAAYPVEEIERLGLRVGTVRAFQGSEAPLVVASLGLVDGDAAGRRRFVTDPNLFNVLVTRAREQMVVVTSLAPGTSGLVGEYLAYTGSPFAGGTDAGARSSPGGWTARLAGELVKAGARAHVGYPVGRWLVDICLGGGSDAASGGWLVRVRQPTLVGLICGTHPDGVESHLERQRDLLRAGWHLVDAFPSRWDGAPATPVR